MSTTAALPRRRSSIANITVSMLLLLVHMLFIGLTFIVVIAGALYDPIPACHQLPGTPQNWAFLLGVLVTLAAFR
jgi:hypothetical protein